MVEAHRLLRGYMDTEERKNVKNTPFAIVGDPEKDRYLLNISDHILDNIYGQIGLTQVERKIELLPLFKRLHNISQLGLVNWIFPCALHTRYTHSIGVMHVAGMMAEHINQNMERAFFSTSDIQLIRLAGLLHDIGHYPLSHNIEQAYKDVFDKKAFSTQEKGCGLEYLINCPDYLNPCFDEDKKPDGMEDMLWERTLREESREKYLKKFYNGSEGMHHENICKQLISNNLKLRELVKEYFLFIRQQDDGVWVLNPDFSPKGKSKGDSVTKSDVDSIAKSVMEMIGCIVVGDYKHQPTNQWGNRYSAMVQIIHSELDADNLDYLLRDATFSGTSYGLMDMGMLLNSLTVATIEWEGTEADKELRKDLEPSYEKTSSRGAYRYLVGVKQKGIGCVEQFLLNRFMAYTQMILSKYVSILEAMLLRVESDHFIPQEETDPQGWKWLRDSVTGDRITKNYLSFSDYCIFSKIMDWYSTTSAMQALPKAIVSCLANSRAFDLADGENQCICTGLSSEEIKSEMEKSSLYQEFVQVCTDKLVGKDAKNIAEDFELTKELFSYRFERFFFTKQQKLDTFLKKYNLSGSVPSEENVEVIPQKRFEFHYCRLGNGIPVIESDHVYVFEPFYDEEGYRKSLPPLSVDCTQSLLHRFATMEYVSLRKYNTAEYSIS